MELPEARRRGLRRALVAAGVLLVVWAALSLASAGYGTRPKRSLAERRSYDMVKTDVRRALPSVLLRGLAGLALIVAGARRR